ncbi:hypothetical protein N7478_013207 [Penicillium angulare]|uniref:uncharacterized protein n=1 Tax=Penicillium angulare TaxID=116970 RepID=UPI002541AED5|nr:uncharacterized protein N7478_013207 [Penicillium angulare]KAJ5257103.1 hypothetical protein N7478_013207 [Penicillium angulare]
MLFTIASEYSRPILRPIRPIEELTVCRYFENRQQSQSTSSFWRTNTHTFSGTGNREIPRCWPPSQFEQDPSNILDVKNYKIHYDPLTAAKKEGVSHMYEDASSKAIFDTEPVPISRIITKRYIPTHIVRKRETRGPGLTLLVLPEMGVPKEMFEPMLEKLL